MFQFHISISGKKNQRVVFFLGAWTMRQWHMWPIAKLLSLNGYCCLTYTYDDDVFSPDVAKTVKNTLIVAEDVKQKIKQLKKQGVKTFYLFGSSLGTMIALIVANTTPEVSKIILNTSAADLADAVWSWDHVKPGFKAKLIEQNISLTELRQAWKVLSPLYNADHLKNKKILYYTTTKDQLIPNDVSLRLVKKFADEQYNCKLITNHYLNHAWTIAYNLLNATEYLNFLAS